MLVIEDKKNQDRNNIINEHDLDNLITLIINESCLGRSDNLFFKKAANCQKIEIQEAFNIAFNWREITKTFLFTAIRGLGSLAEKIGHSSKPNLKLLSVLQTGFSIISDDLSNSHSVFKDGAVLGVNGTHYKWWENTILRPLSQLTDESAGRLTEGVLVLINKMQKLSECYIGFAVQLMVVEAIALDICIAFYNIFCFVEYEGKRVFNSERDLVWITSHIQAEKIHHAQVRDGVSGMAGVALTRKEQEQFLILTREFANAWKAALDDFSLNI